MKLQQASSRPRDQSLAGAIVVGGVHALIAVAAVLGCLVLVRRGPFDNDLAAQVVQASGIVALIWAYAGLVLGLLIGIRPAPTGSRPTRGQQLGRSVVLTLHRQLNLVVLALVVLHALVFAFLQPGGSLLDAFLPFIPGPQSLGYTLGVLALYLAAVLGPSYYLRDRIGRRTWLIAHQLAALSYAVALWHALALGSNIRVEGIARTADLGATDPAAGPDRAAAVPAAAAGGSAQRGIAPGSLRRPAERHPAGGDRHRADHRRRTDSVAGAAGWYSWRAHDRVIPGRPRYHASRNHRRENQMSHPVSLPPVLDELLSTVPVPAGAVIETADVDYTQDGTTLRGFVAVDSASAQRRPGVLLMHDWLGVGGYVQARSQMLARLGYVALAADIYGADQRPSERDAAQVAGRFYADPALVRARAAAGLDQLRSHPLVDPDRIAVIGYCFGGFCALELARTGADLAGAVSFHGLLSTDSPQDAANIRAKVLVLSGAADPVVPDEQVRDFEDAMRSAPAVDWQLIRYSGAMHAFTQPEANAPDHGAAYQAAADRRSWAAMVAFFGEIFG